MNRRLIEKVMKQVFDELSIKQEECRVGATKEKCCDSNTGLTEFIGTTIGGAIEFVIASADPLLIDVMKLDEHRSTGTVGGRASAGPQIRAVDEAVKAISTGVISVEFPRDTKGGAGHGSLIYTGADDVLGARRAVEIALQVLLKYLGDVYENDVGRLEFQYTARANYCLEKALGVPVRRALGMTCAGPAATGTVLADIVVKTANVEVVGYCLPSSDTSYSNEVIPIFTGDSGAIRQAVKVSIEAGEKMLGTLGDEPKSTTTPYI